MKRDIEFNRNLVGEIDILKPIIFGKRYLKQSLEAVPIRFISGGYSVVKGLT